MKIAIVATHNWPIPHKTHTGEICILDLAIGLEQLGHDITMIAPAGTNFPKLIPMRCSYGQYPPSSEECEGEVRHNHYEELRSFDIIHDFSNSKVITRGANFPANAIQTLLGGPWRQNTPPRNLVAWSQSHRNRVLCGETDYAGTSNPTIGGPRGEPVKDCRVVNGGIDTGFYCPDKYEKDDYYLWCNRWHPAKGYAAAIQLAKDTGIRLIMAGEHPDNELFQYQKSCAHDAIILAAGASNITFEFLPADPDHHTAKRELYRRAKALLYTVEFQEPFGLSQAEALACGTPVIGHRFGSVPEVVKDGETGIVADCIGWTQLRAAEKIDPVFCRKNATQRFDRRVMAKNYLALYEKIVNGGGW